MKTGSAPTEWGAVREVIQQIVASGPDAFDADLIDNAHDLVDWLSPNVPDPTIFRGYWPTIIFEWWVCSIEVFEDRFELFRPGGDGQPLDFVYEQRAPGQAISKAFADDLSALLGMPLPV